MMGKILVTAIEQTRYKIIVEGDNTMDALTMIGNKLRSGDLEGFTIDGPSITAMDATRVKDDGNVQSDNDAVPTCSP